MIKGTGAFMVAAVIALVVSKWRLGKVSPMLWLSTVLIVGFGALTIFFRDPDLHPAQADDRSTLLFGVALLVGCLRGKALLKILLEAAFEGLERCRLAQAVAQLGRVSSWSWPGSTKSCAHYARSFEDWLAAKLWVFLPLTFLFTFTQIPMLLKHGLSFEDAEMSR